MNNEACKVLLFFALSYHSIYNTLRHYVVSSVEAGNVSHKLYYFLLTESANFFACKILFLLLHRLDTGVSSVALDDNTRLDFGGSKGRLSHVALREANLNLKAKTYQHLEYIPNFKQF